GGRELAGGPAGEAEVDELGDAVGVGEDVLGLHGAVNDPGLVNRIHGRGDLVDPRDEGGPAEGAGRLAKGPAGGEIGDDVRPSAPDALAVDLDDVRMARGHSEGTISAEALARDATRVQVIGHEQRLQGAGTLHADVVREVDDRHAAPAELALNPVGLA